MSEREFVLAFKGFPVKCFHYKPDEYQQEFTVTAIIVPIRIIRDGKDLKICWACSRGKSCYADCIYAIARQNARKEVEGWQPTP